MMLFRAAAFPGLPGELVHLEFECSEVTGEFEFSSAESDRAFPVNICQAFLRRCRLETVEFCWLSVETRRIETRQIEIRQIALY